ncbi:MAG: hypothetical protein EOO39_00160 [Cytophagaceae bacterium]|nr:MAG: hypothetical protein EOO39_00160 [Cytophagaceae bacterium]
MSVIPKASGIYGLRSTAQARLIYIGSSINLHKRALNHSHVLRNPEKGKVKSLLLKQHALTYGHQDLTFEVLELCPSDQLTDRENKLISLHRTHQVYGGYNVRISCETNSGLTGKLPWNKGKTLSESHRKRIGKSLKRAYKNPALRQRLSDAHLGKPSPIKGIPTGRPAANAARCQVVHKLSGVIGTYSSVTKAGLAVGVAGRRAREAYQRGTATKLGYYFLPVQ